MDVKKVFGGMACIIMVTTLFAITMSAYPAGWGDDIRLTYADGNSLCPAAAIDSNDVLEVRFLHPDFTHRK